MAPVVLDGLIEFDVELVLYVLFLFLENFSTVVLRFRDSTGNGHQMVKVVPVVSLSKVINVDSSINDDSGGLWLSTTSASRVLLPIDTNIRCRRVGIIAQLILEIDH